MKAIKISRSMYPLDWDPLKKNGYNEFMTYVSSELQSIENHILILELKEHEREVECILINAYFEKTKINRLKSRIKMEAKLSTPSIIIEETTFNPISEAYNILNQTQYGR